MGYCTFLTSDLGSVLESLAISSRRFSGGGRGGGEGRRGVFLRLSSTIHITMILPVV